MPTPVIDQILAGSLKVGLTDDVLTAYDCQVVSAAVNANPNLQTVSATFCSPEMQVAAATAWQLDLTLYQDWSADATSFFWFAKDNDTVEVFWELCLNTGAVDADPVTMHGTARVVPFSFGGDAGTPLQATQTWPIITGPDQGPIVPTP